MSRDPGMKRHLRLATLLTVILSVLVSHRATAREFPVGALKRIDQLPPGRLRVQLEKLPPTARARALKWLESSHFTERDLDSLHADSDGGILYVDTFTGTAPASGQEPVVSQAAVPVSPFPASLVFHSKPGSPNVLFVNFSGEVVANTQWNSEVDRTEIPAVAFSSDSDYTTFSDAEQVIIKKIWQRMAEDYAPFDIDVTTERPSTFTTKTAHALITRSTDANGDPNPYSTSGGVAYLNVFGTINYAKYRPAWIYYNNLASEESFIAEAASHEVGHNLGLSHDGTSSSDYYGGHGTGEISWGPLMGTGYHRNVSQWSKGEYYQANNTQDDLATIAGKLAYRGDDHGNTAGTATALTITGGTNIVSTTPENDPTNSSKANKGVLERNTDSDVFSFVAGTGPVSLAVKPWIMPSGTRGGNVDIWLQLYNETGTLVLSDNAATLTTGIIQGNLEQGRYFLHVRNSGAGDPFSSTPTGYTSYGSIGQYFLSGYITQPTTFAVRPVAELTASDLAQSGQTSHQFRVAYSDDVAVDVSTIDSSDVRVTGPNGYSVAAQFVSVDSTSDGSPRTATYAIAPPSNGTWSQSHNGTYTVWMQADQVSDTESAWVAAGELGQFQVAVPVAIYYASMDVDPGWTLESQWQYGTPSYSGGGPTSGFTGTKIIGYNLNGNYAGNLSPKYATTPVINCSGSSGLTLRFKRWLRTRPNDPVSIQVSTDGATWNNVWSTSMAVSDSSWQEVQYALPSNVQGSPSVRLRWSIASNRAQDEIGWNIDDVELLGGGALDTTPPAPRLSVANLTQAGSPTHSCTVSYTDQTAVRLSSLDSTDLVVTGPNGYSNLVEFIGADLPSDGSPVNATYSIPAPGGTWEAGDNGTYVVTLLEGAVEDTLNNSTPQAILGSFSISISTATVGTLVVLPSGGLVSSGAMGGPFSPASIVYTLTNSGGSSLNWTASKGESWVSLSATSGTLAAGASTTLTVSLNAEANALAAGDYSDIISFANVTAGNENTNRTISFLVTSATLYPVTLLNPAQTEGGFCFSFETHLGCNYTVQGNDRSWKSQWTDLATVQGTGNPVTVTNSLQSSTHYFYRVLVSP